MRHTEPSFWESYLNITVVGNQCDEANHVPPLHTVHLDSRSVIGVEALGRLLLTKLPPKHPLPHHILPASSSAASSRRPRRGFLIIRPLPFGVAGRVRLLVEFLSGKTTD